MTTPRRALSLLALLLAAPQPSSALETVAEGFERPGAIAVRPSDDRPVELFLAERGAACVTRVVLDERGEVARRERLIEGVEGEPLALAFLNRDTLLVAGDGIAVYALQEEGPPELSKRTEPLDLDAPCTAVAFDPVRVFALVDGQLARARHKRGRLTLFRPFQEAAQDVVALAANERGYLVALRRAAPGASSIAFYDPHLPDAEPLVALCEGPRNPVALAYGQSPAPVERLLFLLDAEGTVWRLDAALSEGDSMRSKGVRLGRAPGGVGMAVVGQSDVYVTSVDEEGAGKLVRITPDPSTAQSPRAAGTR